MIKIYIDGINHSEWVEDMPIFLQMNPAWWVWGDYVKSKFDNEWHHIVVTWDPDD